MVRLLPGLKPTPGNIIHACALLVAIYLGFAVKAIFDTLTYDKQLDFSSSDSCRLLELSVPVEDLSDYNGKSAFAGAGDIWHTLHEGSATAKDGGMYLVHVDGTLEKLEVSGQNVPKKFIWHGIYYSKKTQRLYGINHLEDVGDSIEVMKVSEMGGKVTLEHLQTITSPLFNRFALNDVVEGDGDEVYVSEWQPYGFPAGGKAGMGKAPLRVKVERVLVTIFMAFRIKTTRIIRCTVGTGSMCEDASKSRFVGANGLARSADGQKFYVVDPPATSLAVMSRKSDGQLEMDYDFPTKHALDNIEMHPAGHLMGGSIPLLYTNGVVCNDTPELSASKTVGGRQVGCGRSPGGMLHVKIPPSSAPVSDQLQFDQAMHDGSKLSAVSAAIQLGDKVVLGSPESPGVLICDP